MDIVTQIIRETNLLNEFESLIKFWQLALVGFAKTTLLKWVSFDVICVETIVFPFPFLVGKIRYII